EKNHKFQANSSAEVVVNAYEEYGFNCLSKLNGMFAFCLWDSKNRWLFSARDRLGMKPLYYYSCQERFSLASEIKGILTDPSVPRKPNKRFIFEYLVTGYPSQVGDTFFTEIKELTPAHYMVIDKDGIQVHKYWQPTQHLKSNFPAMDDNWCASKFRQLLRDSISIRLPTNLPVGTFLSGGLDSTSLAFLVDDVLKSKHSANTNGAELQEVFSAIYNEPTEQGDERYYIKHVEHALKTEVNYVFPAVVGEWNNIKQFVFHIEEPVAVFNYYVFWCLFQAAKQKVKVVFSGQGNDAILGGQTEHALIYFKELWKTKRIGNLLNELVKSLDWVLLWLVWSILFSRKAESKARMLLAPRFVAAYSQGEMPKEEASLQNALLNDVTKHAVEYLRVDDRASSAFSMECRHPFLDHRIVEFAFSLPATQKIRDGWTKYVARNAMKGFIPEVIRNKRKKLGTPIPQQRWMRELRQNIRKLFESNKFRERKYFNQPAILEVFDRYCEGRLSRIERQYYSNVLWRILNLELWLETFFDKE
ncbi:MAG: asparagine synthase (glutamine-hydrolyzing), partial [Candidatus Bathyarchaeota archaeon]|nr:asparagine synthase (glutamine-hydrolyzing) [Candidatus Bathyarchaeota archaeon]